MSINKKYYYLKLKENFFDNEAVLLLESMPDGFIYTDILLKLYLKSLKYEGKLQMNDSIPYTADIIAAVTRHDKSVVEQALEQLERLGLMEQLPDGAWYMSDIQLFIGKSSTEAERKRKARQALLGGVDICPPEIELEIEKELDTEIEIHGAYANVSISANELEQLRQELPDCDAKIEALSEYMASTGKTYQNHAATLRRWAKKDAAPISSKPDYTCNESECL